MYIHILCIDIVDSNFQGRWFKRPAVDMRPLRNEAGFLSKVSSNGIIDKVHGICNCNETTFTWDKDNLSCIRKKDDSGLPTYAWILISLLIVIILTAIGFAFLYAIKNKLI